jgi:hypothetical protein
MWPESVVKVRLDLSDDEVKSTTIIACHSVGPGLALPYEMEGRGR